MSTTRTLTRSFAGGEITPEMYGRLDLAKFQTGLAKCLNFEVLPHGPITNRPGLAFTIECKYADRLAVLIPFIFSTDQAYYLEFGDLYVRFHTEGGTVLEANQTITAITQANPGVLTIAGHGFANGDWLFLASIGGMVELNNRWVIVAGATTNTFSLTDTAGNPIDTTHYSAFTAGGTAARVYEIASSYAVADLLNLHYVQSDDVLGIVHPGYQQRELQRSGATNWAFSLLSFTPTIDTPGAPTVTASAGTGATSYSYLTTAVAADGQEESLASVSASVNNDLTILGHNNTVVPAVVTGAIRYNVYKLDSGLYGFIGQTDGSGFLDDNITADVSRTPPIANDPFVGADNYPGAIGYFQGRRWFAGTNNKRQNVWATRSGTEKNMSYSIPTRDDDAIAIRLTALQAVTVRHIVPISDLLLLTSGSEWKITAENSDVITPLTIGYNPEDYIGASNVKPVVTSSAILYPQDRGGRIREMKYTWEQQGYRTNDISLLAPHLFDGFTITSMAFVRAPQPILWCVRSDGALLGLTYVPEQQVQAWHQHTTNGAFESVCVVPEGDEDVLYATVRRSIGANPLTARTTRMIERLHSRRFTTLADSFFVDCGVTYSGAPTARITGLWHLVGMTVSVLADGAVHPQTVVAADGSITLQNQASVVHVGLQYNCDAESLPLSFEGPALGQGMQKNVTQVFLRVDNSSSIKVGPSFDKLTQAKQRSTENYGSPPSVKSEMLSVRIGPNWDQDATVCVRQSDPLPLTVLSAALEVAVGG